MRITLFVLLTLVVIVSTAPQGGNQAGHLKEFENLRDLVNPADSAKGGKKPRKYKCIVVEDGDDDEIIAAKLTQPQPQNNNNMDKNKFVFIEADEENKDIVITSTDPPTVSVGDIPVSSSPLRFQQQQQQPTQQHQLPPPQQQQQSSFLQDSGFEKITEEEAAVEYPSFQQQQQQKYQQGFHERMVPPQAPVFQQQQAASSRPPLKQIHLPKAHGVPAGGRNNFNAAQTTVPPEIAAAPRDAQNRPLILAPEHCDQIKHYAQMYGVSDVKNWVHHNCSFAQSYLPTASCEEIDILVGSCYRNQLQQQQQP